MAHLTGQPEALRRDVFLAFWTLKEAYIKAVGRGLTMPLDAFAFTLDPLSVAFSDRIDDRANGWLFRRLMPTDETVMALALRHDDPARVRVAVERLTLGDLRAAG